MPSSIEPASVEIRVHHLDAMTRIYSEAFGAEFDEVDTFGIRPRFGEVGGIMLELTPIPDAVDFEGYPVHQPGFAVEDVGQMIVPAEKRGGRLVRHILPEAGCTQAAVRDPDGKNTIEFCSASPIA